MNKDHLIKFGDYKKDCAFEFMDGISVGEWLSYIKNATFVVSDSYHGLCFSLIFEKQFIQLYPRDGMVRFRDLFKLLNYTPVHCIDDIASKIDRNIDYSVITPKLQEKIDSDNEELKNCLMDAVQKADAMRDSFEIDSDFADEIQNAKILSVLGGI